jgi:hypothetical protein
MQATSKAARCARQPRPNFSDTKHPKYLNAVFLGKPETGSPRNRFRNDKNGLPHDRRLREDGFIILAQSMIRTDGFFVRAGFCKFLRPNPTET